jgi:hypothetical protein
MHSWPLSTGQVSALLGVPEHRITSQIRLGKIAPSMYLGRRAWTRHDVLKVAHIVGRDTLEVRSACNATTATEGR